MRVRIGEHLSETIGERVFKLQFMKRWRYSSFSQLWKGSLEFLVLLIIIVPSPICPLHEFSYVGPSFGRVGKV
jgi:ABC-type enterochelin transport system permease subunit